MNLKYDTKKLIEADCSRYYGNSDFKSIYKTKFVQQGFKYIIEFRKVHRYIVENKKGLGYYYHRLKLLRYSKRTGFQIGADAQIGPGLFMNHRGNIIVNGAVKMGRNINLAVGVTIGQENRGKRKGVPTVNFDVPDNSIVIGNPAKIIPSMEATTGYIQNPYEG